VFSHGETEWLKAVGWMAAVAVGGGGDVGPADQAGQADGSSAMDASLVLAQVGAGPEQAVVRVLERPEMEQREDAQAGEAATGE
jgi:hypothetical protein